MFTSSAFSVEAVEMLAEIGMDFWKVPSGEVTSDELFDAMSRAPRPIAASTGMSSWAECEQLASRLVDSGEAYAMMQCTSEYPCGAASVGLNVMQEMARRFGCPVGLSDHSGTIWPSLAAALLGAEIVEVHLTFHRAMFGPDVPASVTTDELRLLVEGVRFNEQMQQHAVDKDAKAAQLLTTRAIFSKSLVLREPLSADTVLRAEHLLARKPGSGIPAMQRALVIGRRLRRDMPSLTPLAWTDIADDADVAS